MAPETSRTRSEGDRPAAAGSSGGGQGIDVLRFEIRWEPTEVLALLQAPGEWNHHEPTAHLRSRIQTQAGRIDRRELLWPAARGDNRGVRFYEGVLESNARIPREEGRRLVPIRSAAGPDRCEPGIASPCDVHLIRLSAMKVRPRSPDRDVSQSEHGATRSGAHGGRGAIACIGSVRLGRPAPAAAVTGGFLTFPLTSPSKGEFSRLWDFSLGPSSTSRQAKIGILPY